jgi:hypothetical protein
MAADWAVCSAVMAAVRAGNVGAGVRSDVLPVIAVTTLVAYEMSAGTFFGKSRLTSDLWTDFVVLMGRLLCRGSTVIGLGVARRCGLPEGVVHLETALVGFEKGALHLASVVVRLENDLVHLASVVVRLENDLLPPGIGRRPSGKRPSPPGIGRRPSGKQPSPPGIGRRPSGKRPCPSGIGRRPPGKRPCPSGIGRRPPGKRPCPSGIGCRPSGKRRCPYGIGRRPPGHSRFPDGQRRFPDGQGPFRHRHGRAPLPPCPALQRLAPLTGEAVQVRFWGLTFFRGRVDYLLYAARSGSGSRSPISRATSAASVRMTLVETGSARCCR